MYKFYTLVVFLLIGSNAVDAQSFEWTSHMGSTAEDSGSLIKTDNRGNVFVTGNYGADFTIGGQDLIFNSWSAHFIAKYNADGELLWVKSYNNDRSRCGAIATDESGNLFVSGNWNGSSIDIDGTILTTDNTHGNFFIAKYDNDGNLIWATNDFAGFEIENIEVDNSGHVCFAGSYYFPSGVSFGGNTYDHDNTLNSNQADGIIGKIDREGAALWAHTFNGPDRENVSAIGTDFENNVYIAGRFNSDVLSIDNSSNVINKVDPSSDGFDLFIMKYDFQGNLEWIKSEGGNATVAESLPFLAVDIVGNVTVISDFRLNDLLIDDTRTIEGKDWCTTSMVIQFDTDGKLKLATSAFGSNRIIGKDITSYRNKLYLTGAFSEDFSSGGTTLTTNGEFDTFIAELDDQGNWNWAISFGGDLSDRPEKFSFDNSGNLYFTVSTNSMNLNIDNTNYTGIGGNDFLIGKLGVGISSDVNDLAKDQILLTAFPNPVTNNVLINLGDQELTGVLELMNTSGKCLDRLNVFNKSEVELDLSTYPKGVYFVKMNVPSGGRILKLIKN